MAYLYFWTQKHFLQDNVVPLEPGDLTFSQDSAEMGRIRDARLWVFTKDRKNVYVLAASVKVSHTVEQEVPSGRYRIVAVPNTSCRYRLLNPTKEVESAIRSLSIAEGWGQESLGTSFADTARSKRSRRATMRFLSGLPNSFSRPHSDTSGRCRKMRGAGKNKERHLYQKSLITPEKGNAEDDKEGFCVHCSRP